jgi:small subunit ribosomal protein S11
MAAFELTEASEEEGPAKNVGKAIAHVQASFNNTIVTITDTNGEVIAWELGRSIGYKGSA